jgi:hypothetical protein
MFIVNLLQWRFKFLHCSIKQSFFSETRNTGLESRGDAGIIQN